MSGQFNWFIDDEEGGNRSDNDGASGWLARSIWFLIVTAVLVAAFLTIWQSGQNRVAQSEKDAGEAVQHLLDLERDAFLRGDGDLFFSFHSPDPAWLPAQFLPVNMEAARAGFEVTRAEPHEDFVWANLSWEGDDQTYQRIAFFQWQGERLVHMQTAPGYWGEWKRLERPWGEIVFAEVDEEWVGMAANFVAETIDEICQQACVVGRLPFILHLASDYKETAVPDQLRIPSPRLIALDENGDPADLYWNLLRQRLETHFAPAVIRFAIPPPTIYNNQTPIAYDEPARRFMADNPDIIVELVHLETLPEDLAELAAEFDGAAIPPTVDMVAAGLVHDLTDYIETDPHFDEIDFFPQIWLGGQWQERVWMMPHAASMRVLYYDLAAYREAELPAPSLRWTWDEMAGDIAALIPAQPDSSDMKWGFADTGLDALYSYAYNWNNQCEESATVLCHHPLTTQNVAAALEWYSQMAGQPGQMPDLTRQIADLMGATNFSDIADQMSDEERQQFMLWNIQTSRREAAIWVDLPVEYERQLLLSQLGAVPFPGSDRFDGITPLWVEGSFISQSSERPLAVWQWLKYLTYQRPTPRMIPARPSVATDMGFWTFLPRPLGDAMRTAFPFARPVTIEEKQRITWEQVTAVVAGKATPMQAAQTHPTIHWFE